jgi:hypothetical protein
VPDDAGMRPPLLPGGVIAQRDRSTRVVDGNRDADS